MYKFIFNLRHLTLTSKVRMGCEALSFFLEHMGNSQPAYHLKDPDVEGTSLFSNMIVNKDIHIYIYKHIYKKCICSNTFQPWCVVRICRSKFTNLKQFCFLRIWLCHIRVWHYCQIMLWNESLASCDRSCFVIA